MVETVKFNVGGKHFEVSRNLIEQDPTTTLAKMISKTWEKQPGEPMFIDRDGEKFAYVLDYLRYGSIDLPPAIPLSMFTRELDYYCIPLTKGSVKAVKEKSFGEVVKDVKTNHVALDLAFECHNRFYEFMTDSSGSTTWWFSKDHEQYNSFGLFLISRETARQHSITFSTNTLVLLLP
jgi:hypothetical protein